MNRCFVGDCRDTMRDLIAQGIKVQMCVTSPPYYGLRDYGHPDQLGLESTPREYISRIVDVFGLVRELLAEDGTAWVNIGDCYAGPKGNNRSGFANPKDEHGKRIMLDRTPWGQAKQLIGIPWRLAFALQDAGWYLRQDIIWHKPNPMPESVTDRCTKAHEYIFLLAKSKRYYFDAKAIGEHLITAPHKPGNNNSIERTAGPNNRSGHSQWDDTKERVWCKTGYRNKRSVWTIPTQPYAEAHFATFPEALITPCILAGSRPGDTVLDPFFGSGTTGVVAERLGRQWIGCELNERYRPLWEKRTAQQGLRL